MKCNYYTTGGPTPVCIKEGEDIDALLPKGAIVEIGSKYYEVEQVIYSSTFKNAFCFVFETRREEPNVTFVKEQLKG